MITSLFRSVRHILLVDTGTVYLELVAFGTVCNNLQLCGDGFAN